MLAKKETPNNQFLNGMSSFINLQDKLRLKDSSRSSALCKGASGYIWSLENVSSIQETGCLSNVHCDRFAGWVKIMRESYLEFRHSI